MATSAIASHIDKILSYLDGHGEPSESKSEEPILLTDTEMQHFLVNGYILKKCSLPDSFHKSIHAQMEAKGDEGWGNNITSVIPELTQIWNDDPVIKGALLSLLGPNFDCQGHRHLHRSHPGFQDQSLHRDSHWGYSLRRSPRPRRVMAMYYCQDVANNMGPTSIIPRSHLFSGVGNKERRLPLRAGVPKSWNSREKRMTVERGSVCIIDFDLWHRGTANKSNVNRYMLKMQFIRNVEPEMPSWNFQSSEWQLGDDMHPAQRYLVLDSWKWLLGEEGSQFEIPPTDMPYPKMQRDLFNTKGSLQTEIDRLTAATHLASTHDLSLLKSALQKREAKYNEVRKNAIFGMIVAGNEYASEVEEVLLEEHKQALTTGPDFDNQQKIKSRRLPPADSRSFLRARLAFALGEIGTESQCKILEKVCVADHCSLVQRDAAEAIGHIVNSGTRNDIQQSAVKTLRASLDHPVEQVRMIAARALRQIQMKGVDLGSFRDDFQRKFSNEKESRYAREIMNRILHHKVHSTHELDTYVCPITDAVSEW